jgi:adenylosuccinate lyase
MSDPRFLHFRMHPLSPLDGRYASKVELLRPFFTEDALNKARVYVELVYYIALSHEKGIPELKSVTEKQDAALGKIYLGFDEKAGRRVKEIEKTTNHDVKAVEYYLREEMQKALGKAFKPEFLHFGLTSEDVNNLAYGILIDSALEDVIIPALHSIEELLTTLAKTEAKTAMLSLTHGQPATPTTLGKEMLVFVERLQRQIDGLWSFSMQGKFGGAVGNFSAHKAAYPSVDWEAFGKRFIEELGLEPLHATTQINPHDDIAELSHTFCRINTILLSFSRDIWFYISRGVFRQKTIKGEVGSSTMPHKVNPIDFENAEGNLGLSSALFSHFAEKLPVSRLQRDLSDSTVQRNIGVAFGYHLLALSSLAKGISKLSVDHELLKRELVDHPEVLTEAIQTVMRKNGITDAYEQMKGLSRGKAVTRDALVAFVKKLDIDVADRARLLDILGRQ